MDIHAAKHTTKLFPELEQFFVPGAPCVLGENISPSFGLANGTVGTMLGLCWENPNDKPKVNPSDKIINCKQPQFIIVKFKEKIVPVKLRNTLELKNPMIKKKKMRSKKSMLTHNKTINYSGHNVELLFAITYHKTQSKTLKNLILLINRCKSSKILDITINSLIVGISRVKSGNHLRVLDFDEEDLKFLLSLKHNPLLKLWYDTYDSNGNWTQAKLMKLSKMNEKIPLLALSKLDDLKKLSNDQLLYFLLQVNVPYKKKLKSHLIKLLTPKWKHAKTFFSHEKNKNLIEKLQKDVKNKLRNLKTLKKLSKEQLQFYTLIFDVPYKKKRDINKLIPIVKNKIYS